MVIEMNVKNSYVAPWVLPNESFPVHCVWEPCSSLAKICIKIPKHYTLVDTLNFDAYVENSDPYRMFIKSECLKSDNYFGIILKYSEVNFAIEKKDDIEITFLNDRNEKLKSVILETRIIRPVLELIDYPVEVTINDNTNLKDLITIEILHKGFGTADLNVSVFHGGTDNIAKPNSLFAQVLKQTIIKIRDMGEQIEENTALIEINEFTESIVEGLLKSKFPEDLPFELEKEDIENIKQILNDKTKRAMIYRIIQEYLRPLLLTALLYYSEKHPEEDIKFADGKVAAVIKNRVEELTVNITYTDSCKNKYTTLCAKIRVLDKRSDNKAKNTIDVPINLVWKRDTLKLE